MDSSENILEKTFQNLIILDETIKKNIIEALNLPPNSLIFEREVEFVNGITPDFIIYDDNTMTLRAIIECKRSDIGVTEFVRGIGQVLQHEYFLENAIPPKKFQYLKYPDSGIANVLMVPSSFICSTELNLGKFKYPKSCSVMEVHTKNNSVRKISVKELKKLASAESNNLVTICQYYMRDNRLFEYYILLNLLTTLDICEPNKFRKFNRNSIINNMLREIEVINNGNWKNAFISLSSLGFIDSINRPTLQFSNLYKLSLEDFVNVLYEDYIHPFVDVIMNILVKNGCNGSIEIKNLEIAAYIRQKYNNRDVLFLSESNSRYISSWLNIMRDDIGCIDFEPNKNIKKIKFNFIPHELSSQTRINKIKKFSKGYKYLDEYYKIRMNLINKEI